MKKRSFLMLITFLTSLFLSQFILMLQPEAVFAANAVPKKRYKKYRPSKKINRYKAPPKARTYKNKNVKILPKKAKPKPVVMIIDDFEDGNYTKNLEWWKFDRLFVSTIKNRRAEFRYLGDHSILLEGSTINWYIGGMGTYLGKDVSKYDTIKFVIFGNGPGSGSLKVELYDDDNKNWEVDINADKGYEPTADDKFAYMIDINWKGWKVISIPFDDFEDENPDIGDDKWNPYQKNGSGGLLQLQLITLSAGKAVGKIDAKIDTIKLFKK